MAITIPSACLDFDPRSKEDQMFQALKNYLITIMSYTPFTSMIQFVPITTKTAGKSDIQPDSNTK